MKDIKFEAIGRLYTKIGKLNTKNGDMLTKQRHTYSGEKIIRGFCSRMKDKRYFIKQINDLKIVQSNVESMKYKRLLNNVTSNREKQMDIVIRGI